MEQNDAVLGEESRRESQQSLLPTGPTGPSSNSRALKIAGITTLVCLLLSAQAFTAYMVFGQSRQIQGLQADNQRLQSQLTARSRVPPQRMARPAASLPLFDLFSDEKKTPPSATPETREVTPSSPTVEEQLQELIMDHEVPKMNQSFLANLETLKRDVSETEWKSFEAWMRYWLIFQMAQKTPPPAPPKDVIFN